MGVAYSSSGNMGGGGGGVSLMQRCWAEIVSGARISQDVSGDVLEALLQ